MKHFKISLAMMAAMALLITSCSQEEEASSSEKAALSFATMLNDLSNKNSALKQALSEFPECSDDDPAFVEVVLSGTENVGSLEDPLVVSVNPTPDNFDDDPDLEYFTEEAAELELEPGTYFLEYFAVYNGHPDDSESDIIWLSPTDEGSMAGLVADALPMQIDLGAGVKKYVDVEVLCFEDRFVNEYGYLFFDLENTEAIEFCIFGNFCPPSGRHYPASYSVDVWFWEGGEIGDQLHNDLTALVTPDENGDFAADPVCMMLPDTDGLDEYYAEITLLSSDPYGNVQERVIRSGVFNDMEVRSFFDGDNNLDYYHFREGCEGDDGPPIFDDPDDEVVMYKACLEELNNSNVVAFAYLELEGNTLQTHVFGFNLEDGQDHAQVIRGLEDPGVNATCPPDSADEDENGIITLAEGLPFYGDVLIDLDDEGGNYPTVVAGMTSYSRTWTLGDGGTISADDLGPLENRVVVLHGMSLDGQFFETVPIACAEIVKAGECQSCD